MVKKEELTRFHFDNCYWQNPQDYGLITLFQIGDLSCKGGYRIGKHLQKCYEINYIVSGKGWFEKNGVKYDVKQGDIFVSIPGEIHDGQADSKDPFRCFYIGFAFNNKYTTHGSLNSLSYIEKMLQKLQRPVSEDLFSIHMPFQRLLEEIANNIDEYSRLMIEMYLYQILIITYRNFYDSEKQKYFMHSMKNTNSNVIYKIICYIENNLLSMHKLQTIGNALGYSYSYLSRVFAKEIGLTLQDYCIRRKIDKALELLRSGEFTITEVADKLGYKSVHSFSKSFKKIVGISPTQYREFYISKQKWSNEKVKSTLKN